MSSYVLQKAEKTINAASKAFSGKDVGYGGPNMKELPTDCKWFSVCPMKRFYEQGKIDIEWIDRYCKGDWESCIRYQMAKRREPHPDWMLPDGSIDEDLRKIAKRTREG